MVSLAQRLRGAPREEGLCSAPQNSALHATCRYTAIHVPPEGCDSLHYNSDAWELDEFWGFDDYHDDVDFLDQATSSAPAA